MSDGRCERCDRAECEYHTGDFEIVEIVEGRRCVSLDFLRRAEPERDCRAHAVDWRAEALRMRPVVGAAEAWSAVGFKGTPHLPIEQWPRVVLERALFAYRATKPRAGEGG